VRIAVDAAASRPLGSRRGAVGIEAMAILFLGGFGVFAILMGLWLYRRRARDHAKAVAAAAWPRARARVTANSVGVRNESTSSGNETVDVTYYIPQVWVAYEVGGTSYQASRISYADLKSAFRNKVVDRLAKYPVGAEVDVAYDPGNPAESVIEVGTKGTSPFNFNVIFLFAAGVVSIVAGVVIQILGRH
jgi:hypothetical protein